MSPLMRLRIGARLLLLQARWDPARMQGTGLSFALDPWLAACWSADAEGLREARRRHLGYFNTHPVAAWLAAGVVCRLEASAAAASGAEREALVTRIESLKRTLGASLAGLYDAFFWGSLRPASALAGLLTAQAGYRAGSAWAPWWGVAVALALYNGPAWWARLAGLRRGYDQGDAALVALCAAPCQKWIRGLRWSLVVGAVLCLAAGAGGLPGGDRLWAGLTFAGGMVLSSRGVSPLTQIGFAGAGALAASLAGFWPS
jgi:PTS system mannose-specific IID component